MCATRSRISLNSGSTTHMSGGAQRLQQPAPLVVRTTHRTTPDAVWAAISLRNSTSADGQQRTFTLGDKLKRMREVKRYLRSLHLGMPPHWPVWCAQRAGSHRATREQVKGQRANFRRACLAFELLTNAAGELVRQNGSIVLMAHSVRVGRRVLSLPVPTHLHQVCSGAL